jgi:DNA invertase Pin-like site-specific DNA recombinase
MPDELAGIREEDLPVTGRELVPFIGLPAVLCLVSRFGGLSLDIPKGERNNFEGAARFSELSRAIGAEAARALIFHCGGTSVYVPNLSKIRRQATYRQIIADFDSGQSTKEIARRYGFTDRWVNVILNRPL